LKEKALPRFFDTHFMALNTFTPFISANSEIRSWIRGAPLGSIQVREFIKWSPFLSTATVLENVPEIPRAAI